MDAKGIPQFLINWVYCNPKTPFFKKYFPIFFKKEVKFWTLKKLLKSKYKVDAGKECLVKRIREYNKQS